MARIDANLEKSPTRKQTEQDLKLLSTEYSNILGLDPTLLEPLLTRSFTEAVGSEIFFKPNALPYLFRARQLAGKLDTDPEKLKAQLQNTWLAIVDVSNLKLINEMDGSSHKIGDEVITLHTRSLTESTISQDSTSHCLVRFMGDEFADFINDPAKVPTADELKQFIDQQTKKLIKEASDNPNHPLHNLAKDPNKVKLIDKVVQFTRIKDIQVPVNTRRADDLVELMYHAAESQSQDHASVPTTQSKKILHAISTWGIELPKVMDESNTISSIDTIISTINQTNFSVPSTPEIIGRNDARLDLVVKYLPSSLKAYWDQVPKSVSQDPQKLSSILTLFEEALFNSQFSRTPPILNDWVFNELAQEKRDTLNQLQMVSTPFPKLYNVLTGRLGATSLLKDGAKKTLSLLEASVGDDASLNYIIKKQGASFYVLMNNDTRLKFKEKIKESNKNTMANIIKAETLTSFFQAARDYLFYTPIHVPFRRSADQPGNDIFSRSETLRHFHYLGEIAQLLRECNEHKTNHNVINFLLYYISERSEDRLKLLRGKSRYKGIVNMFDKATVST